jgi:hypothetical protein
MLFKPSFCCNCGERIERSDWKLWTSRRFCDLCATDFQLQEFLPKVILGLAALVSIIGVVNFFAGGKTRSELTVTRAAERQSAQTLVPDRSKADAPAANAVSETKQTQATAPLSTDAPRTLASLPPSAPPVRTQETTQPVYFCGAETKKGTPCSRKVKGNVRCWQHTGMPAMLPPEKLLVSR